MCMLLLIPASVARPFISRNSHPCRANSREPNVQKHNLTGIKRMPALLNCEGQLLPPLCTESPVTPPCRTHDMAACHLAISCDDTRTILYRAGLWRDATTLLVGIGSCKISVGTSAKRIPNTSFSKQGHRYGAVNQLSHDGPPDTLTLCRLYGREGRQVIGRADGERLSATTLPLTG
jgi:hypothetical protein